MATGSGVESLRQPLRRKIVARAPAQLAATLSMVLEMEQSARSAPRTEPGQASGWVERRFQSCLEKTSKPGVHEKSAVKLRDFQTACS